jgi:hypothetical protein
MNHAKRRDDLSTRAAHEARRKPKDGATTANFDDAREPTQLRREQGDELRVDRREAPVPRGVSVSG